jgi:hypothetical protein
MEQAYLFPQGYNASPTLRIRAHGCNIGELLERAISGENLPLRCAEKFSVSHTMTDRSITFCNSRILPGQDFLVSLEKQIWATWLPVVASAALALGFVLGTWFASVREVAPTTPGTVRLQKMPMETSPQSQVMPQRRKGRH